MKQTLFLACEPGTNKDVAQELIIRGFTGKPEMTETTVTLACTTEELVKAAYLLQTPTRICQLLHEPSETDDSLEGMTDHLRLMTGFLTYENILAKGQTFHVECEREGDQEYNSVDISKEAGKQIKQHTKESVGYVPPVDLKRPDVLFYLHVTPKQMWLALDLLGKPADKRPYKIFNNPHSIKGPTAACLLLASGWTPGKTLLDPYCSGGVIPIEAALMSTKRSLHFYEKGVACRKYKGFEQTEAILKSLDEEIVSIDAKHINAFDAQLRNVTAAKKNAKIGGVEKSMNFSKLDVEWLDTKLSEKSVDYLVTQPVEASKHIAEKKAMELHKHLFYQADFVLAKKGVIAFLCQRPEDLVKASQHYAFEVKDRRKIRTGKLERWILSFSRKATR